MIKKLYKTVDDEIMWMTDDEAVLFLRSRDKFDGEDDKTSEKTLDNTEDKE